MPNIRANNSGPVPLPIVATSPESGHDVDRTGTAKAAGPAQTPGEPVTEITLGL